MFRHIAHLAPGGAVDEGLDKAFEEHVSLLEELVRIPSTAGGERPAQQLLAGRLADLGFGTRWVELSDEVVRSPGAGVPYAPLGGRAVLVAERDGREPIRILLNGHIDVVPPGDEAVWSTAPFSPARRNGWLTGRGAGDMKGGLVMALLALHALTDRAPEALDASLAFVVAPEEESSGVGTLASILDGVAGDVVVLPEPTDLEVLVSGIGVLWCRVRLEGTGAHAGADVPSINPFDSLFAVVSRIRSLQEEFAEEGHGSAERGQLVRTNLGTVTGGDWPSSLPVSVEAHLRVGFPEGLSPAQAEARIRAKVAEAKEDDPWLAANPPALDFRGLRAEPHRLEADHPLVRVIQAAHAEVHGTKVRVVHGSATSDARFYLRQAGIPAVCYGPRSMHMHGVDEAVELASILNGARTLTRALPAIAAAGAESFR